MGITIIIIIIIGDHLSNTIIVYSQSSKWNPNLMMVLKTKIPQSKQSTLENWANQSTLLAEKRSAHDCSSLHVTINASRDAATLATAEAWPWFGYAFVETFYSKSLDELLRVSLIELRLHLLHHCFRRFRAHRRRWWWVVHLNLTNKSKQGN